MLKEFTKGLFPIVIFAFIVGDLILFYSKWINGIFDKDFCLDVLFSNISILIPVILTKMMLCYKFKDGKDSEHEE